MCLLCNWRRPQTSCYHPQNGFRSVKSHRDLTNSHSLGIYDATEENKHASTAIYAAIRTCCIIYYCSMEYATSQSEDNMLPGKVNTICSLAKWTQYASVEGEHDRIPRNMITICSLKRWTQYAPSQRLGDMLPRKVNTICSLARWTRYAPSPSKDDMLPHQVNTMCCPPAEDNIIRRVIINKHPVGQHWWSSTRVTYIRGFLRCVHLNFRFRHEYNPGSVSNIP